MCGLSICQTMMTNLIRFFLVTVTLFSYSGGVRFSPVTARILGVDTKDVVAAFGDFDADKMTDIFVIRHSGQIVDVLLQRQDSTYPRKTLINLTKTENIVTSVMLGDFDGDVSMDILITYKTLNSRSLKIAVYYGNGITTSQPHEFPMEFPDQPLVFDYNGDMIADILVETSPGNPIVLLGGNGAGSFTNETFSDGGKRPAAFTKPQSHAFVDINGDLDADLVLTTKSGYEPWIKEGGVFKKGSPIHNFSQNLDYVGQSSYGDFNQDGLTDLLVPVCVSLKDGQCEGSALYIYSWGEAEQWHIVDKKFTIDLYGDEGDWQFVPPGSEPLGSLTNYSLPASVRVGDYNIDGFPDLLVVMALKDNKNKWHQRAFLLMNVPCDMGSTDCTFGRHFAYDKSMLGLIDHVLMASFFDLYEDGTLDVLLLTLSATSSAPGAPEHPNLMVMSSYLSEDACFIKVLSVSGRCSGNDCPGGRRPYGVNIPGPTFYYRTTRGDGTLQQSRASQLTQSAYFPLQLPFNIIGLGPTPNFVEQLSVGIPSTETHPSLHRKWTEIIPNSQLIVIPSPITEPSSWTLKLFVTPSKLVYYTGTALVGTCGIVAVIVGFLHWKEKREDLEEKKQEAQKFHFDAM